MGTKRKSYAVFVLDRHFVELGNTLKWLPTNGCSTTRPLTILKHPYFSSGDFLPPPPATKATPEIKAHYSFDMAQQVQTTPSSQVPCAFLHWGFLECAVRPYICQVKYFIGEAIDMGKGANIITMLHHFFEVHGQEVHLQADNCLSLLLLLSPPPCWLLQQPPLPPNVPWVCAESAVQQFQQGALSGQCSLRLHARIWSAAKLVQRRSAIVLILAWNSGRSVPVQIVAWFQLYFINVTIFDKIQIMWFFSICHKYCFGLTSLQFWDRSRALL